MWCDKCNINTNNNDNIHVKKWNILKKIGKKYVIIWTLAYFCRKMFSPLFWIFFFSKLKENVVNYILSIPYIYPLYNSHMGSYVFLYSNTYTCMYVFMFIILRMGLCMCFNIHICMYWNFVYLIEVSNIVFLTCLYFAIEFECIF